METLDEKVSFEIKNLKGFATKLWWNYTSKANFFKYLFIVLSLTLLIADIVIGILINKYPNDNIIIGYTGWIFGVLSIMQLIIAFFSIFDGWRFNSDAAYALYKAYKAYKKGEKPYDGTDKDEQLSTFLDQLVEDEKKNERARMKDSKDLFDSKAKKNE